MDVSLVQAIVAIVGLLGMGSLGGFVLALRRFPYEQRASNAEAEGRQAVAAKDMSAAWQPLVDQLQEEVTRLRVQLSEQARRIECLEERDALAAVRIGELTQRLTAAEGRVTELERRNKLLEEENARLRGKRKGTNGRT